MAKCYNCGKSFDYDKYYGICPKCSAYNKEKLPEEEHQELHEAYDQEKECNNLGGQEYHSMPGPEPSREYQTGFGAEYRSMPGGTPPQGYYGSYGGYGTGGNVGRPKSSGASIAVFILLILAIVVAIGMPIVYLMGKSMNFGIQVVKDTVEAVGDWEEDDWASLDDYADEAPVPENQQPRQSVEIRTAGVNDPCLFGREQSMTVTVTGQPYVKVPAGQMPTFPEGEKLVAIPVSYSDESTEYTDYNALGIVYIGYGEQKYRAVLSTYDMEGYAQELELTDAVDAYSLVGGRGEGTVLVFVPEEFTEFSLYLESRDGDTNQMLGLYEIPLVIQE